jgi:hypothetical protein
MADSDVAIPDYLVKARDWLRGHWAFVHLPSFLPILLLVGAIWRFAELQRPLWLVPIFAFVLHPPIPSGLALFFTSTIRERRLRAARANAPAHAVLAAYSSHKTAAQVCGWLERLPAGMLTGHWISAFALKYSVSPDGFNAVNSARGGIEQNLRVDQALRLRIICAFVLASMLHDAAREAQSRLLEEFCGTLPQQRLECTKLREALALSFQDGRGFLSTLQFLYLVHFTFSLPGPLRERIVIAFNHLNYKTELYGWLSYRVFQLVAHLAVQGDLDTAGIKAAIQGLLTSTDALLESASGRNDLYSRKFSARNRILLLIRSYR